MTEAADTHLNIALLQAEKLDDIHLLLKRLLVEVNTVSGQVVGIQARLEESAERILSGAVYAWIEERFEKMVQEQLAAEKEARLGAAMTKGSGK